MKKVALMLASFLVIMLAGCGGEGSSSSASASSNVDGTGSDSVEVVSGVGVEGASLTTPEVPNSDAFANLSVGTPPGLPE